MITVRRDGWTKEEDELLVKIILKHIREGSTQLQAFAEVGRLLSRTEAACGFRWNSTVRKKYADEIINAKREKSISTPINKKMPINKKNYKDTSMYLTSHRNQDNTSINLLTCINYLEQLKEQINTQKAPILADEEIKTIIDENKHLRNNIKLLQQEKLAYKEKLQALSNNYKLLLTFFDEVKRFTLDDNINKPD